MRLFVYEFVCGGGMVHQTLPASLAAEGWAMLSSVIDDFSRVNSCEIITTVDERLASRPLAAQRIERIAPHGSRCSLNNASDKNGWERAFIQRLASECDWSLIIAPEFDGILADRVRWVEQTGSRHLGSSAAAITMTGDKLTCCRLLLEAGVNAVTGRVVKWGSICESVLDCELPVVIKPRDGAGAQDTFLIRDVDTLERVVCEMDHEKLDRDALVQPFVSGQATSVSLLIGRCGVTPLLAGTQQITTGSRLTYEGGRMPLDRSSANRATLLAVQSVAAIPGLHGFVGVDLVLSTDRPDTVIEINPRLTTSYVGLRALCEGSLADALLQVTTRERSPALRWKAAAVCFDASGRVTFMDEAIA